MEHIYLNTIHKPTVNPCLWKHNLSKEQKIRMRQSMIKAIIIVFFVIQGTLRHTGIKSEILLSRRGNRNCLKIVWKNRPALWKIDAGTMRYQSSNIWAVKTLQSLYILRFPLILHSAQSQAKRNTEMFWASEATLLTDVSVGFSFGDPPIIE